MKQLKKSTYERRLERSKNGTTKTWESSNKKSDLNSTISMIVLNVNGLKGQRLLYWIKKKGLAVCSL